MIDNAVDNLYAAWSERIFVIDQHGKIVYARKQGPWGFKPNDAERALRRLVSAANHARIVRRMLDSLASPAHRFPANRPK